VTAPAGLLDTSAVVATEVGRPVRDELLPGHLAVSVVTLAELRAGVLAASDPAVRAQRLRTLERVSAFAALDVDDAVASEWAALRVALRDAGRRIGVNDLWIAAVARVHRLPVVTQDDDFDVLAELGLVEVVKV